MINDIINKCRLRHDDHNYYIKGNTKEPIFSNLL